MLDILPIIYRKPRQLDPPHQILVKPAVPRKSKVSCSIEPSTSRSLVTINRGPRREIHPRSKRPMRTRRGPSLHDQTLAETKKNYKTLMSLIKKSGNKEDQSDIYQPSDHSEVISHQVIVSAGRGDIRPSSTHTATAVNTSRGNISPPKNPFSYAIQVADQLLADLSAMGPITVRSSRVPSTPTATVVTTSRSNISPPQNPFSYAIQADDQLLADLTSMGPAPARSSRTPRVQ